MNRITAFWAPLLGPERDPEVLRQLPLVQLWREAWKREGWDPQIVSFWDAVDHPKFWALSAKAWSLPSVNHRGFEFLNFIRWCAFARVAPSVFADYDVFPRLPYPPPGFHASTNLSVGGGPGMLYAEPQHVEAFIDLILEYEPRPGDLTFGKPHVSDMVIMQNHPQFFEVYQNECICYTDPGWDKLPLTHFGASRFSKGVDRVRVIKSLLNL